MLSLPRGVQSADGEQTHTHTHVIKMLKMQKNTLYENVKFIHSFLTLLISANLFICETHIKYNIQFYF